MSALYVCCVLCMHIYVCTHTGRYKCHVMHYVVCVLYVVCLHVCVLPAWWHVCVCCMCVCVCRYVCSVCVVYVGGCMWGLVDDILSYIAFHFIF